MSCSSHYYALRDFRHFPLEQLGLTVAEAEHQEACSMVIPLLQGMNRYVVLLHGFKTPDTILCVEKRHIKSLHSVTNSANYWSNTICFLSCYLHEQTMPSGQGIF